MSENDEETIRIEIESATAIVTLDRPEVLNALNAATLARLSSRLADLEKDENVRCIIITGAGEKAFAAGADIGELNALATAQEGTAKARAGQALTTQIERLSKPVIMAVNGYALGGGCELAMAGDIRIASENAKFGQPEVGLGLIPGYGGTQRLARLAGKGAAMYLCLSGESVDAAHALRIGLVDAVVPRDELMAQAKRIATAIAAKAPLAVQACKRAINDGLDRSLPEALEIEAQAFGQLVETHDFAEGTRAFLEKRKPVWTAE